MRRRSFAGVFLKPAVWPYCSLSFRNEREYFLGGAKQVRALINGEVPHNLNIYTEILVHEQVSKADDPRPLDFRLKLPSLFGEASDGFADILKVTNRCVEKDVVLSEVLE